MNAKESLLNFKKLLIDECTEEYEVVYTKENLATLKLERKIKDTCLTFVNGAGWMAWASAYHHAMVFPNQTGLKELLLLLAPFVGFAFVDYDLPSRKAENRMIQLFENEIYLGDLLEVLKQHEFNDIFEMEQGQLCEPELAWNMFATLLNEVSDQKDEFMSGKSFDQIEVRHLIEDEMLYSLKRADLDRLIKATAIFEERGVSKTMK